MEVISVTCSSCGHAMKFGADKAGRKAKCPKCEAPFTIPSAEQARASATVPMPADAPITLNAPEEEEDDGKGYGVVIDTELIERRKQLEEEDRRRRKEAKKKKAPKVQRRFNAIPDAEEWEKVRLGLLFIFFGTLVWAFAHALQGLWVTLGSVEFRDYARMVADQLERREQPLPAAGNFWDVNQLNLLVGMVSGRGFLGFAKFCLMANQILYFIQTMLWFTGYIICLPVPRRFGTFGTLLTVMILGGVNFIIYFFFRLLPILGAYQYYLIPYVIPELMMTEYNMERALPFFLLWSSHPFWESLLTLILYFVNYTEPALGAVFVWSVAMSIKVKRLEDNAQGVSQLGFGQYFILMAFIMISLCGTTPVLINLLRVLYMIWYGFLLMFIVRYALLLWRARHILDTKVNPDATL